MYKLDKLEQDISEVEGAIEDFENSAADTILFNDAFIIDAITDLKDKASILKEDLKDHLETIKNFISDVR